jgi:hypothetical protein
MIKIVNKYIDNDKEISIKNCESRYYYGFENKGYILKLTHIRNQYYWICIKANVSKIDKGFSIPNGFSTIQKALKWALKYFEVIQAKTYREFITYLRKGEKDIEIAA